MRIGDLVPWRSQELTRRENNDPFTLLRTDMNRLLDSFMSNDMAVGWPEENTTTFNPRINVTESDSEMTVSAELPGMTEEDVDVTIMRDALSIKGEKKVEVEEKETNYYRMERSYGSFTRTIPLPESVVDQENVSAEFRNGVLTITLPKLAEAQSVTRKIPVNTQE